MRIGLAAPTGKAAARLEEAVRRAAAELPAADRDRLGDLRAVTLHRLLGWLPQARGRFRHDANNQLPHDVIVVDETSMVSLTLMARLVEAVRPTARLLLVGDPDQLSSVEAGAVLADVVRAPGRPNPGLSARLAEVGATGPGLPEPVHGVVQLTRTWRFGRAIDALARAIRGGNDDAVMAELRAGSSAVRFIEIDPEADAGPSADTLRGLAGDVQATGAATLAAARAGDVPARPGGVGPAPAAVRPPARAVRGRPVEPGGGALAGRGRARIRRGRRVVPRPAAAGDGQRLRDGALQRRYRRHRRHPGRGTGRLRPRRRGRRCSPRSGWTRCRPCTR